MKQTVFFLLLFTFISLSVFGQGPQDTTNLQARIRHMDRSNSLVILGGEMMKGVKIIDLKLMSEWQESFRENNFATYWAILVQILAKNYSATIIYSTESDLLFSYLWVHKSQKVKKRHRYVFDPEKLLLIRKK